MSPLLSPLHLLLVIFAGWVNRHQLDVIEYLQEENRVLKERLGGRRIRFTDAERRRLARKAHALGRKVLNELHTLVTPDTLLRWYREMVACKWNYSDQGIGDTLCPVLHRYRQPRREDRGYHSPSGQPVDDTDRAESHRPERRLPSRQALFDSRSGYEILGRIPQHSRPRRHSSHSTAATFA